MRVVVALGGNALLRRGEAPTSENQQRNARTAAEALAPIANAHDLVVTHGNGPQVGLLAAQTVASSRAPRPLDVLDAETEGWIGYLLESELRRALPATPIATLLTQVAIDAKDPALSRPTKPIGPPLDPDRARALCESHGWQVVTEASGHLRRVVPSPEPLAILELGSIRLLVDAGHLVVCAGGGGIPVARGPDGAWRGVEAVVDKDASSALLAEALGADALLLLTDEPAVFADWPARNEPIRDASPAELGRLAFEAGSMGPKVAAACRFAVRSGRIAAIGALEDAEALLRGDAGTRVRSTARG